MRQVETIKKTEDFSLVYQKGHSCGNRLLVMYALKRDDNPTYRLGISVSKKVGNSVVRHRLRRLIKECFRLHYLEWAAADIVVVARKEAVGKSYEDMEKALLYLGNKNSVILHRGEVK